MENNAGAAQGGISTDTAPEPELRKIYPEAAFIFTWFVPGAGHFYLGQKRKAAVFFFALVMSYVFGAVLSSLECLSLNYHPYAFLAQLGIGGLTLPIVLIKNFAGYDVQYNGDSSYFVANTLIDPGLLYTQVAGLLNILVMLDAFDQGRLIIKKRKEAVK